MILTLHGIAGAEVVHDVDRGELVFKKCCACHSLVPGETGLTGPNLFGAVGRAVASALVFDYSDALEALPAQGYRRWTEGALDAFIAAPEDFAPGTTMTLTGLPDSEERAQVIAYLARQRVGAGKE